MISTGSLIWTSIRPLARTLLTVAAGFGLTKADLFSTEAARGVAQVVLNIAMPCLLFSRIVPAFTSQNIGSLVPLTVVGLLYGVVGVAMASIIKYFFWVPHRFRYGVLAAGAWGNYGDIPTAIAMSITASAPFGGVDDENLAIAYIAMLILVFFITLFPLGGFLFIAKDFEGPDVESEEIRETMRIRRKRLAKAIFSLMRLRRLFRLSEKPYDFEARLGDKSQQGEVVSRPETADSEARSTSSPTSTLAPENDIQVHFRHLALPESAPPTANHHASHPLNSSRKRLLAELLKPMPVVIVFSIVIALVDPLKALFLPPSTNFQPHFRPVAPDGQPPLAFILDTATFIGGASVPIGLVSLGSALAHLRVGPGKVLPQGAIATLALAKMAVTPIFGVGITRLFVYAGFVHRDDKVLQFVCMLFSGLPTSTTQVYLTQIYSPTGSVKDLSAFLIPQYILMPFTITGLVAYSLNYLF